MIRPFRSALAPSMVLSLGLLGCPPEHDDSRDPPELGATPARAVEACQDYVAAAGALIDRACPEGAESTAEELAAHIEAAMPGPCTEADGIRDEASFRQDCLPALDDAEACPDGEAYTLPEACRDQLQFRE